MHQKADPCRPLRRTGPAGPAGPAPADVSPTRQVRSLELLWKSTPAAFSLKTLRLIFSREFREKLLWFLCIVYFSVTCWTFSRDSSPALLVNIYSLLFEAKDKSPTTLCTASPAGLKVMEIFSAINRHQQWKLWKPHGGRSLQGAAVVQGWTSSIAAGRQIRPSPRGDRAPAPRSRAGQSTVSSPIADSCYLPCSALPELHGQRARPWRQVK